MTYPLKKYRKCTECGRGFPGAHMQPKMVGGRPDFIAGKCKPNKNKRCNVCIRKELAAIENADTVKCRDRVNTLQRMLVA